MEFKVWRTIRGKLELWLIGALPGLVVIALVILARLTGSLQFLECTALDNFLRLRPAEPPDSRIVIVGINEADIHSLGTYPIPDHEIAALLVKLQQYKPRAIGLDIFRDIPIQAGHLELKKAFQDMKNLIVIEKALPDDQGFIIPPPSEIPSKQVGFADTVLDTDGYLRRSLLGTATQQKKYKFSLALRLAETYLAAQGISLENGIRDPDAMRFGSTELTRFLPNSGGYVDADAGGNQILLNFRSGEKPFRILSLEDITTGNFEPNWIQGHIVIIGITGIGEKDIVNSAAIPGINPGLVYGVQIHAHTASQIISAVLDGRPLLKVWSKGWEYLWILGWGFLGIRLGRFIQSPLIILLCLGITSIGLAGICYLFLVFGSWWVPVVPAMLAFVLNGAGIAASLFYLHEQDLRFRIEEYRYIINLTFNMIHRRPLQTLALMLRNVEASDLTPKQFLSELERLNQELRAVHDSMLRAITLEDIFRLGIDLELNLQSPLHELLFEVYSDTMSRDLPCFQTIKVKVIQFEEMDSQFLDNKLKWGLCQFIEEALCNVGKHAIGANRLSVICKQEQGQNIIRVIDNGLGIQSSSHNHISNYCRGWGTNHARNLARQLRGRFQRLPNSPKGTICELVWPAVRVWFWQF